MLRMFSRVRKSFTAEALAMLGVPSKFSCRARGCRAFYLGSFPSLWLADRFREIFGVAVGPQRADIKTVSLSRSTGQAVTVRSF